MQTIQIANSSLTPSPPIKSPTQILQRVLPVLSSHHGHPILNGLLLVSATGSRLVVALQVGYIRLPPTAQIWSNSPIPLVMLAFQASPQMEPRLFSVSLAQSLAYVLLTLQQKRLAS